MFALSASMVNAEYGASDTTKAQDEAAAADYDTISSRSHFFPYRVRVRTDRNGEDIRMRLMMKNKNEKGWTKIDGHGKHEDNTVYRNVYILESDNCYFFQITDLEEDGLCCEDGKGYIMTWVKGVLEMDTWFHDGRRERHTFCVD